MREKAKFQMGSRLFFGEYPDFESKDSDWLYVMTGWKDKTTVMNFRKDGRDCFFVKDATKDVLIRETLDSNIPLRAGKFLSPEFAGYLGMTTEDLKQLKPMIGKLDDRHKYMKIIFNAYIKNGSFTLTDRQRKRAYGDYVKKRKEIVD